MVFLRFLNVWGPKTSFLRCLDVNVSMPQAFSLLFDKTLRLLMVLKRPNEVFNTGSCPALHYCKNRVRGYHSERDPVRSQKGAVLLRSRRNFSEAKGTSQKLSFRFSGTF